MSLDKICFSLDYFIFTGESGLGKSTLINSLFLSDLYSGDYPGPSHRIQKTVKVDVRKMEVCIDFTYLSNYISKLKLFARNNANG